MKNSKGEVELHISDKGSHLLDLFGLMNRTWKIEYSEDRYTAFTSNCFILIDIHSFSKGF